MNALQHAIDHVRSLANHHLPVDATVSVSIVVPAVLLIVGLIMAVLGAKLVRPILTLGFAGLGCAIGVWCGQAWALPMGITSTVGTVVLGIAGFLLLRLWVGLAACIFFSVVSAGLFGSPTVLSHLDSYAIAAPEALVNAGDVTDVGSAGSLRAIRVNPEFRTWATGFWNDVQIKHASFGRHLGLITIAAGIFGLLLGLMAVRFTTVLLTTLIGTSLLTSSATALSFQIHPTLYQGIVEHPQMFAAAAGSFVICSFVLQALLTRSDKSGSPKKSKS